MGRGGDGKWRDRAASVVDIRRYVCRICGENALGSLHVLFELSHQVLCLLPVAQGGMALPFGGANRPSHDRILIDPIDFM